MGFVKLTPDWVSITAGGSDESVLIDAKQARKSHRFMIAQRWTGGTSVGGTGMDLYLLPGVGADDAPDGVNIKYATLDPATVDKVPLANPSTGASPSSDEFVTVFFINFEQLSRFMKFHFDNLDASIAGEFLVWGEV